MKQRVFYVLHLDRGRIWVLATLFVSTLLFAFATGFRVGAARSPESTAVPQATLDLGEDTSLRALGTEEEPGADGTLMDDESDLTAHNDGEIDDPAPAGSVAEEEVASRKDSESKPGERRAEEQRRLAALRAAAEEAERKSRQERQTASNEKKPATNPRSALLDSSGSVKMANVSKSPRTSETESARDREPGNTQRAEASKERQRKTHSLQLAAFRSKSAADRMIETLKKQGFHPYIVKSKNIYLVRIGRSDSAKELWAVESKLRDKKYSPMRVSH